MAVFRLPTVDYQRMTWTSYSPSAYSKSFSGRVFTREVVAPLYRVTIDLQPLRPSVAAVVWSVIEQLQGRRNILIVPLPPPADESGWVVGNFVIFTGHSKLYRITTLPPGQSPHVFDPYPAAPRTGLPPGWQVSPAIRVANPGEILRAGTGRFGLMQDASEVTLAPGVTSIRLELEERVDL